MANILTAAEGANVLRTSSTDATMLFLMPLVDAHIKRATGRDWAADNPVRDEAKAAAMMLLTLWYENPAMAASGMTTLDYGLTAVLLQLEVLALELEAGS